MELDDLMQPCPVCTLPYEYGEEVCSACFAWLTIRRAQDGGLSGFVARRRTGRIVTTGTLLLLGGSVIGLTLVQATIISGYGLVLGRMRDWSGTMPVVVIVIGILFIYGFPGRTLHHYPGSGLIRRGAPRRWKGVAASVALIVNAVVVCELFFRPALEDRAVRRFGQLTDEVVGAITVINLACYAAVALVLVWNLIAHYLGPQNMSPGRRETVMRIQARHTGRPSVLRS